MPVAPVVLGDDHPQSVDRRRIEEVTVHSPLAAEGRQVLVEGERAGSVAQLRSHRSRQLEQRLALGAGWRDQDLVFTSADGSHIHPDAFSRWFQQRTRSAGLPVIRLHDLRHTHASLGLAAGVHVKVMSERLGHANTAITADIYSHATPAMQADAAELVARLVSGS